MLCTPVYLFSTSVLILMPWNCLYLWFCCRSCCGAVAIYFLSFELYFGVGFYTVFCRRLSTVRPRTSICIFFAFIYIVLPSCFLRRMYLPSVYCYCCFRLFGLVFLCACVRGFFFRFFFLMLFFLLTLSFPSSLPFVFVEDHSTIEQSFDRDWISSEACWIMSTHRDMLWLLLSISRQAHFCMEFLFRACARLSSHWLCTI